tara:strand:- start:202 stop:762 length:561 start_codon:yes stop_codon:yes gene_type:complete
MYNVFSSFLSEHQFEFNLDEMKKDILNTKSKTAGKVISNYGGWQGPSLEQISKPFIKVFNEIDKIVAGIIKELRIKDHVKLHNYWFNVNGKGSFNRPHNHFGAIVSGVYYIDTPQDSGKLIFKNTYPVHEYYGLNIDGFNQYNSTEWNIQPKENLCVLFPSYLTHYVESNLSNKDRISISFNYGIA